MGISGRQADDTAGGQVGTGEHDASADAQRDGQRGRREADDVDNGADFDEVGVARCGEDDEDHQQDVDGVVEQGVDDLAALILGIHRFELGHALLHIGDCLHG